MNQTYQSQTDNLALLRILYLVKGGLNALVTLFFLLYMVLGAVIFPVLGNIDQGTTGTPFPVGLGWLVGIVGFVGFAVCLTMTILTFIAASRIVKRKSYGLIIAAGVINCFTGMLGVALGVFTFVEMTKPAVKAQFEPSSDSSIGFN